MLFVVNGSLFVHDGSCKNTMESIHGLMSQVIKDRLFNQIGAQPKPSSWTGIWSCLWFRDTYCSLCTDCVYSVFV